MIRISKSVLAVGGVVLASGLITVMNPKTVHAVAAALVQVTNTASNPVVNSEATISPSQIVDLNCNGGLGSCFRVEPGGPLDQDAYVVPANQTLVITDIEIFTSGLGGTAAFALENQGTGPSGGGTDPISESVADNGATYNLSFSRGVVFPSGFIFRAEGGATARLRGYLVPNG